MVLSVGKALVPSMNFELITLIDLWKPRLPLIFAELCYAWAFFVLSKECFQDLSEISRMENQPQGRI